jgi:hypothetical protein
MPEIDHTLEFYNQCATQHIVDGLNAQRGKPVLRKTKSVPTGEKIRNKKRGIAPLVVVVALSVAAALGWAAIKLPSLFAPTRPDVAGLNADEIKLASAQAAAADAQAQLKAAQDRAAAAQLAQTRQAQQMSAGVAKALAVAPVSPAVTLAVGLNSRAQVALAAAIGGLPTAQQDEIVGIVNEALSQSAAQVADAQAKLVAKDQQLTEQTQSRQAAEAQGAQLAVKVQTTAAAQSAAELALAAKTNQVAAAATALADEQAKGSLLGNEVKSLLGYLLLIGGVYFAVHYLLPILAQTFPQVRVLAGIYNLITSFFSAHAVVLPPLSQPSTKN